MKNFNLKRLSGLALAGSLGILHAPTLFAAAGDTIGNTATLNYSVNGATQTLIESAPGGNSTPGLGAGTSTDFLEDRVVNFTVSEVGGATTTVAPNSTLQVQTFTVTNNGNGTQDFIFSALNNANGTADPHGGANDNFDVVSSQVFVETTGAGFSAADDTNIFADQLAPLASVTVYIVSTIPDDVTVADDDLAVMSLVAQVADGSAASADDSVAANAGAAITNDDNNRTSPAGTYNNGATAVAAGTSNNTADTAGVDVVFNDPAGTLDSAGAADTAGNGQASADDSYTVSAASLTVTKIATVLNDPVNGSTNPKAIPGAYVTYTVTVANTGLPGDAAADTTTTSDALQAAGVGFGSVTLAPDFNDAAGAPTNAAGDSFEVDTTGTARASAGTFYCTSAADADGCDYTGGSGGTVTLDASANGVPGLTDADAGYDSGELQPGDTVIFRYNAIID